MINRLFSALEDAAVEWARSGGPRRLMITVASGIYILAVVWFVGVSSAVVASSWESIFPLLLMWAILAWAGLRGYKLAKERW